MQYMVETKNLRKVYRTGDEKVVALDNIDLTIEQGQVCCILGTSGSGKSTLLNQLAGLEKPTRGTVKIKGELISKMSEKQLAVFRQKHIGFVFQFYNLVQNLTALAEYCDRIVTISDGRIISNEDHRHAKAIQDPPAAPAEELPETLQFTDNTLAAGQGGV